MRKLDLAVLVLVSLVVVAGCAKKKVDVEAGRTELRAADTGWSNAANSAESFVSFMAPEVELYPPNEPAVVGIDNVRTWASRMMSTPGFSISWEPQTVEVAASGDVGYTAGTYALRMQGPDGAPMNDNGKYLTTWKKDTAGAWKVTVDMFNSDLPAMPASAPVDTTGMWNDK